LFNERRTKGRSIGEGGDQIKKSQGNNAGKAYLEGEKKTIQNTEREVGVIEGNKRGETT